MKHDSGRSPRYAVWALAILFLAYVVAFMDRQVLNLVVEPIKHDVGLSDTEVSLSRGFPLPFSYRSAGCR